MQSDGSVAPTTVAEHYPTYFLMPGWFTDHRVGRCIGATLGNQFVDASINYGTNEITFQRYVVNDSNITEIGDDLIVSFTHASGEGAAGVAYGSSAAMDFPGTDRNIYLYFTSVKCYAYEENGTRIPEFDFPMSGAPMSVDTCGPSTSLDTATGFEGFRSTIAYQAEGDLRWITKYTDIHWLDADSSRWWVSSTWRDSVNGYETARSSPNYVTMQKRAALSVTVPPYPDPATGTTADSAGIYLGRGASDPGRLYMEFVDETFSPNRVLVIDTFDFPVGPAAIPPPSTTNFPLTSPGKITSADGVGWVLSGDGTVTLTDPDLLGMVNVGGDLDVTGDTTIAGDLIVTGTITSGTPDLNLAAAWGDFQSLTPGDLTATFLNTTSVGDNPNDWAYASDNMGAGSTATVMSGSPSYELGQSLRLRVPVGEQARVRSPLFPVVGGETYLIKFKAMKSTSVNPRVYIRLASGSTQGLTEYPAYNPSTRTPSWNPIEDFDPPQGSDSGVLRDGGGYTNYGMLCYPPSGMNWAAISFMVYQPSGTAFFYFDEVKVYQLTGDGAYEGGTGVVAPLPLENGWVDYGGDYSPPGIRRHANKTVEMWGLVKDGTTNTILTLPEGFVPETYRIATVEVSGSTQSRISIFPVKSGTNSGKVQIPSYAVGWSSLSCAPWSVAD